MLPIGKGESKCFQLEVVKVIPEPKKFFVYTGIVRGIGKGLVSMDHLMADRLASRPLLDISRACIDLYALNCIQSVAAGSIRRLLGPMIAFARVESPEERCLYCHVIQDAAVAMVRMGSIHAHAR